MKTTTLLGVLAVLSSWSTFSAIAETGTYTDHKADNSIEARIEAVRNTDWGSLLQDPEIEGDLVAKSKWKNGKGGNKWGNSRNTWGNGGYHGGWRNGGGGWKNGGGGFVNW